MNNQTGQEMCLDCKTVPTDESLCDDCFEKMPMNEWVTVGKGTDQ